MDKKKGIEVVTKFLNSLLHLLSWRIAEQDDVEGLTQDHWDTTTWIVILMSFPCHTDWVRGEFGAIKFRISPKYLLG